MCNVGRDECPSASQIFLECLIAKRRVLLDSEVLQETALGIQPTLKLTRLIIIGPNNNNAFV